MSHLDDLREVVRLLEEAYDVAKEMIEREFPDVNPLLVTTTDGRFMLLESLAEIVRARAVLAEIDEK